ncbi:hypothetical protein [Paenibacillus xylanexedens]|uniref:hypothetical protein n=1 Tax=Paenibacillus xylanexedens TaxID=528191 RepID=UPI0011A08472|nr:hypothetical protein [Paenibacillus xylanexedens]
MEGRRTVRGAIGNGSGNEGGWVGCWGVGEDKGMREVVEVGCSEEEVFEGEAGEEIGYDGM